MVTVIVYTRLKPYSKIAHYSLRHLLETPRFHVGNFSRSFIGQSRKDRENKLAKE